MVNPREEKIVSNIGLVHCVANKFRLRGVDYDDLFQAGCVGLIKAVDNFDESKSFAFSTYAVPVIMGEIKRIFRDGGLIKASRSLKEKAQKLQVARDKFCAENSSEPTVGELSRLTGISTEEIPEALGVLAPTVSLSGFGEDGDEADIPVDDSEKIFNRLAVMSALSVLSSSEKKLVYLRFFEGKTQSDTAKQLGISQVQVSRKEKLILLKMRDKMGDND